MLPPMPSDIHDQPPNTPRNVDNRPAWRTHNNNNGKRRISSDISSFPSDEPRKKGRAWVFTAQIIVTPTLAINSPMPLDVDNGLPGVELWFGHESVSEVGLLCHLDSCAAINTGNLHVHQCLITAHPHLVAEYLQYD